MNPLLLDAVESVLVADILLWDCGYITKEPGMAHSWRT